MFNIIRTAQKQKFATNYSQYNMCRIIMKEKSLEAPNLQKSLSGACAASTSPKNLSTSKQMSGSLSCIENELLWVLAMFLSSKIDQQNRAIEHRFAFIYNAFVSKFQISIARVSNLSVRFQSKYLFNFHI